MLGSLAGWYNLPHTLFKDQKMRWALPLGKLNDHSNSQVWNHVSVENIKGYLTD